MTLPTNDDFANRELSIDELETIAAGGLWGWIKHEVSAAVHWVEGPGLVAIEKVLKPIFTPRPPGQWL